MSGSSPRRLRSNFAWTFGGNGLYAASRWLCFAVLAKLIAPDEVGHYALAVAVVAPIFAFSGMNLRSIQSTDANAQTLFRDYSAARLITTSLALMVATGLALCGGYSAAMRSTIALIACIQAFDWLSDLIFGLFDQKERFDISARSLAIRGPLRLIGLGTVVWATRSLAAGLLVELCINAGVFVLHDSVVAARFLRERATSTGSDGLWPRWDLMAQRKLLTLSLPMALMLLIASLQVNLPRYFVEGYEGSHELGLFAGLLVLASAGTPIVTALGQAALPRLARHWMASEATEFRRIMSKLVVATTVLGGAGILAVVIAGRTVLRVLYTTEYSTRAEVLVWLMFAGTAAYIANILAIGVTATREYRPPLITQLVAFAIAIPIYMWFTANWGPIGASCGFLAHSLISSLGFLYLLSRRRRRI